MLAQLAENSVQQVQNVLPLGETHRIVPNYVQRQSPARSHEHTNYGSHAANLNPLGMASVKIFTSAKPARPDGEMQCTMKMQLLHATGRNNSGVQTSPYWPFGWFFGLLAASSESAARREPACPTYGKAKNTREG